jgi:hypothetical protein
VPCTPTQKSELLQVFRPGSHPDRYSISAFFHQHQQHQHQQGTRCDCVRVCTCHTAHLHTGRFALAKALWGASSSYRFVRDMAVRSCSKCCQLFRAFLWRALFVRGDMHPFFSVGPPRQREVLVSCLDGLINCLLKKTLKRHRAGFEPQRASPFMKRIKAPLLLGGNVRARTTAPLFVQPSILLEVLASSTSGDQPFSKSLYCKDQPPHQDWG